MDWGRHTFNAKVKPFRNSDAEVTIKWFPCAPGAKALNRESLILNDVWDYCNWDDTTKGSQPVGEWVNNFAKPVTGARADHVCGTDEDFRDGCIKDESNNVRYAGNGLPLCCGVVLTSRGGGASGGVSVPSIVPTRDPMTGGVEVGGAMGETWVAGDPMAGGLAIGGEFTEVIEYADPMAGGLELGGEFTDTYHGQLTPPDSPCSDAPTLLLPVSGGYPTTAGDPSGMWKFGIVAGTTYHVRVTGYSNIGSFVLSDGADCATQSFLHLFLGVECFDWTAGTTGIALLTVTPDFFSNGLIAFEAGTGAC